MLKDKLINLCLHERGSVTKYLRQIQKTQLELQGINQCVLKVVVIEQMLNILPPSYETIYNAFNG
jgi:chorismate-pyruvate lyase